VAGDAPVIGIEGLLALAGAIVRLQAARAGRRRGRWAAVSADAAVPPS
jgi:hypothetical protein